MAVFAEIERIQAFLREMARQQYHVIPLPPFTLFFHPTDPLKYFNYAIPDVPCGGDLRQPLAELCAIFRQQERTPRFEFFEAFAPDLPAALRAAGFTEEARQWSMVCTPQTLVQATTITENGPHGLEIRAVGAESPAAELHDFIQVQCQGFYPQDPCLPGPEEVARARQSYRANGGQGYLGYIEGEPAGASHFNRPLHGITEITGVATRVPFRRRGIAARLTWEAVRAAFAQGAQTACLTAEDAAAGRIYERIGFRPFSTMLAYSQEETPTLP